MEFTVPAVVLRFVDADTIAMDLDLGWDVILHDQHVRIAHIDAPEKSTPEGREALIYAMRLIPVGAQVTLISHRRDKYGRALGSIAYGPDNLDFGAAMLTAGMAVKYEGGHRGPPLAQ